MSRQVAAALLASAVAPAWAAGGAHLIDDAAVEIPGTCHTEDWATAGSGDHGLVYGSIGCTAKSLPRVEFGAYAARTWADGGRVTSAGLIPKVALRSDARGLSVALAASAGWETRSGRFGTASLVMPLTLPVARQLYLHVNVGGEWLRGPGSDVLSGAQLEWQATPALGLMAEVFRRDPGRAGAQAGLRWTTGRGRVDLDLLLGRYVDGVTRSAVTVGFTLRY